MSELNWQPIETAPKDGTLILVTGCNGLNRVLAAWWTGKNEAFGNEGTAGWRGVLNNQGVIFIAQPTHWMPLPDPPEAQS